MEQVKGKNLSNGVEKSNADASVHQGLPSQHQII